MDKLQKFELMNKIVRELEDLQNSQNALITKIGQIEVDNMNGLNDSYLETNLSDMHSKIAENVDAVTEIFAHFERQRDEYAEKNSAAIAAAEAAAAVAAAGSAS
jgi:transcriptional regulator of heat shock response